MKRLFTFILAAALLFGLPNFLTAQTVPSQTVLSGAMNANTTTMLVASATGFTASSGTLQYWAVVDQEAMRIRAVSGTTITVDRGVDGTQTAHRTASVVFTQRVQAFILQDKIANTTCTRAAEVYMPQVNPRTGNIWDCDSGLGYWRAVNLGATADGMPYHPVTDAAYTAGLYDYFIDYNSLTAARTVTLPAITGIVGKVMIIRNPGQGFTITVAGSAAQGVGTHISGTTGSVVNLGAVLRVVSARANANITGPGGPWYWATW